MLKIPFSVYDFFGYLASGFLVCVGADYIVGKHWLLRDDVPLAEAAFWVVAAYIAGHIIATPASWLYERILVGKVLGRPNANLMARNSSWWRCVFPGYFTPLPEQLQERIREKAGNLHGETLFHHVRTKAKADKPTWDRTEVFLHLYGFCRNVSFSLLVIGVALLATSHGKVAVIAFVAALGMLYRYLKFHRQYSYELLTAYPDLAEPGTG